MAGSALLLDGVSLTVSTGEMVGVVGMSGSGKTLLLRTLLGLVPFQPGLVAGQISLDGRAVNPATLRGQVGMLFQDARASLDPLSTSAGQVAHAARLAGGPSDAAAVSAWLARAGFIHPDEVLHLFPHELSGGMAQRVATAVALARGSSFLLCDEPTTGLDAPAQQQIMDELRQLQGVGLVFVSHDLALLDGRCNRVIVLEAGRIVDEAPDLSTLSGRGKALVEAAARIGRARR